jgi:hypothetical protein
MFSNNLVMAVKVNGKVLREFDGTVALPFGSEYSIFLKNLSSRTAEVSVIIDGKSATDSTKLIINPGQDIELKRFIKNGNLEAGNAFKFIEKTEQISEYRGDMPEDGLITVTYEFEREPTKAIWSVPSYPLPPDRPPYYPNYPYPTCKYAVTQYGTTNVDGPNILRSVGSTGIGGGTTTAATYNSTTLQAGVYGQPSPDGITAPGSIVDQKFSKCLGIIGDGKVHSMTLKLVGKLKDNTQVSAPVVVKKLERCSMCGTYTKQTAKFCHNCGASVQIV